MSLSSSPPSFSPSRTIQPSACTSHKGLTLDELIDRMRAVPDPAVPLVPTEHYNNSYFGFLTEFRRAVDAAIPGAEKYQTVITKEAGCRWRQCDKSTKMHWTLLASATNVFKKKKESDSKDTAGSPHSNAYKAHRVSRPSRSRKQSLRWSPYAQTSRSGTVSSTFYPTFDTSSTPVSSSHSMPLPHCQAAIDYTLPVRSAWDVDPGLYTSCGHAPTSSFALDLYNDHTAPSVFGAFALSDLPLTYNSGSLCTSMNPSTLPQYIPGYFEGSPSQTVSDGHSPPTPHDVRLFNDLNVEAPSTALFDVDLINALCLELSGLQPVSN